MKTILKLIAVVIAGAVAAGIPITCFYFAWSWCMDQVPMANEWAGLIKIGLSLIIFAVGGATAIGLAILCGGVIAAVVAAVLE